jgi:23S rRNA pseudouridine1911/1915/1917 synthase
VHPGKATELRLPEQHLSQSLSILFEDEHCLALDKPAGQFVQGTWAPPGEEPLETAVRRYLDPAEPDSVYLGIVHRLDRPTSGLILWAKTEKAARRLATQFQGRRAAKEYWAIVEGQLALSSLAATASEWAKAGTQSECHIWTDWLTRPDKSGRVSAVEPGTLGAREAVTRVNQAQVLSLPQGCSRVKLWPETGRTHQLRIQAARRGSPILGDTAYGARRQLPYQGRIALHARSLSIKHPSSGADLLLVAPLPLWWRDQRIILEPP